MGGVSLSLSLAMSTACLQPFEAVAHDQVDLIEINHYHDPNGKLVLDQVIFYEWCAAESRFQVRDWRLLKSRRQIPRRDWQRRDYVVFWRDGDIVRKIRAPAIRETRTMYDPEVADREFLPRHRRRCLAKHPGTSCTPATLCEKYAQAVGRRPE